MERAGVHTRAGLSLVELLVAVAITANLATFLAPVFAQARERARQTACLSNPKQQGTAIARHGNDYDGMMPRQQQAAIPWDAVWNTQLHHCPSGPPTRLSYRPLSQYALCIGFRPPNLLNGVCTLDSPQDASSAVLVFDRARADGL